MTLLRATCITCIYVIGCLLLVGGVAGFQAYMGDTIPLQGSSYGSQTVYLFLTGPNLPANGVALDNINARADEGHFTQVDVDSNDHWTYKWGTNAIGGRLDAGAYTVWVSNSPTDRSHLNSGDYSTISIILGTPAISVVTPTVPGTLVLNSTPSESSVVINDVYRGKTPLTLEGIDPGSYTVTISRFGYTKFSTPVKVVSGRITEVTATLVPETGSLAVNTSPAGVQLVLDGVLVGQSPVTLTGITVGNHLLTIQKDGFAPVNQSVRVTVDQQTVTNIVLVPQSPYPTIPLPAAGLMPATLLAGIIAIAIVVLYHPRS
ncbi:MAG: PEGA domain-containing protein [Methanoregula sp.]|nr:PEGA domain-containing protein [Methanoregula sp.]